MFIPPFAPPPYMESQAYILPHPHIQPVDYRRFLHPQAHGPSAPYQNPNHTRRIRPPVRETVNSAVQTELTQRHVGGYTDGSPPIRSDSGHGTASNSPSSSSSSSQKQGTAEVENFASTNDKARNMQTKSACTNGTGKHAFNILISHPTQIKTIQSGIRAGVATQKCCKDSVGQENIPPYKNAHCNMWSVGSSDSIIPVCSSSQQEEEVIKERRISFPDILMSWVGGTPQATLQMETEKVLCQDAKQLPSFENKVEQENSNCQSPKEAKIDVALNEKGHADNDAEILSGSNELSHSTRTTGLVGLISSIRQSLAFADEQLPSPDKSHTLSDPDQKRAEANSPVEPTEVIPYEIVLNSCQMKRKMNESVWSVESLCPFIPSKEWVHQKSNLEPEIIVEMTEDPEDGLSTPNGKLIFKSDKERRQSSRFSSSDFVPMSDSWLVYSTPGENPLTVNEKLELEHRTDVSVVRELEQGFIMTPAEINPSVPLTSLQHENVLLMLTAKEVDENRSSEPEADGSPNQESVTENGQQERSSCSPQQKRSPPLSSAAGDKIRSTSKAILQNTADRDIVAGPCENKETSMLGMDKLCALVSEQRMVGLSPSKGHLVDFGVQCSKLLPCSKDCCEEPLRRHPIKYSGSMLLLFFFFLCKIKI